MKKTLLSCLALALLAVGAPVAKAQDETAETKPVVVAAFSGYAELKRDLEYLGTLSGNPDMAKGLEQLLMLFTQNQGLAGLDQARPWGASLSISGDGSQFPVLAFLPITDLKQLLDALAGILGEAVDAGDDVFEIKRGTNTFFISQNGEWAYIAQQKGVLKGAPSDPLKQLGGLEKGYDLALGVHVQNIPQALRDMAGDLIKQGLEARLQQQAEEDEDDDQAELKAQLARHQADAVVKAINEIDQLTLGLNVDRADSRSYLDISVTALEGSDAAKQFAASQKAERSRFSGFLMPDAAFSLHLNAPVSEDDEEQAVELLGKLRSQLLAEIDKEDDLGDAQRAKAKELAGKLLDVVDKTLKKEGRLNAGLAVVGDGPVTLVFGGLVADGAELERVAKQFVTLAAEDAELPKPRLNVAKHKGHRFHALSTPAPQDDDAQPLKKAFGDPLVITLAFGDDAFYVAVGKDGLDSIKRVIDKSAETYKEPLPPLTASLALAPLLKLAAAQNGSPVTAAMAESLQEGGKDRVKLTVEPIDKGVRYRLEGEEGINKLLGSSLGNGLRGAAGGR